MKILVVEDDQIVARTLNILLSSYNYAVDIAADGEAGLQMADAFDYDLMVLDVILPKLDGISLCQQLRSNGFRNPILLLTGQGGGRQKAIALNAGADDYVVKPFDSEELVARIQALLRRGGTSVQPILTWGNLSLDPNSRKVNYGRHLLDLTPKQYAILELFLRYPQRVFSARAILDQSWNSTASPGEATIRGHIKEIRQKLEAVGAPKDLIKTVYQAGYRMNPLYSSVLAEHVEQQPTMSEIAELTSVNEELRNALEELQVADEELRQQNEELIWARQTIEQERQRYEDLFEFAPDGYVVTDLRGKIQKANWAAAQLFGVGSDWLCGKPLAAFVPISDRQDFCTRLANLDFVQDWEVNLQLRHAEPFPVMVAVTSIRNLENQVIGLRWSLRDIRQRKQMEQQLQAAHAQLELWVAERTAELVRANVYLQQQQNQWQALFDYALDAIVITDDEGRYVDANPTACELFGVSRAEFLRLRFADFAAPEMDVTRLWQQFLQQGQMSGEFRLHQLNGTIRETELTAIANFVPGRHLSILRDITERKRIEAERRQQLAREHLVAEITHSIRQTLDLKQVLQRAVDQVRQLLQTDRVIIFHFQPNWRGNVLTESVGAAWCATLSMTIHDPCFAERYIEPYRRGRVSAIADLAAANLEPCYLELLESFQVKASLIVPILQRNSLQGEQLWGLLIAHHCVGPRVWLTEEIDLLKQLANQLSIAIQQAELYQRTRHELLERRRMQDALEESEERFRSLSACAPIGIRQTNADGICLYVNARWQEMSGLSLEESLGNGWLQAIHPDDREAVSKTWEEYIERGGELMREVRLLTPQGDVRWIFCRSAPIRSSTGEVLGYVSTQEDITDRKRVEDERRQAEAELKQNERKLRAVFDSTYEFMGLLTPDGMLIDANRAALDIVAADLLDVVGQPFWETPWWTHFPEQQQQLQQAVVCAAKGEFVRFETKHIWADGTLAFVDFSLKPVFDEAGKVIMLIPEGRDITSRKLAEEKIREQAALIDIATDAIFVCDLENRVLFWNQGAERLYGWTAAEALGQNADNLFLNASAPQLQAGLEAIVERGVWQGELEHKTKTDQTITVASRWTLVRDESGQPKSILVVNSDITEKKQLETQFYRAQRLESIGTLASGIAHDLNNAFTPILALSQLLRLRLKNLDARSKELLDILDSSAEQGANLVKQILTFARGTEGKRILLQVGHLLHEVAKITQQTFPKSIEIRKDISSQSLWLVSADPTHLHQVLMNLCLNARDAMPDGGILTLSAHNQFVDVDTARIHLDAKVGNYVMITVADTGMGIAPELLDRIFDPFFTTKEPGEGTGLGLSTVLGIVKNYGGFLQVSSEVGKGTEFRVYLPAIVGATLETAEEEIVLQGNGRLVLIVDDEIAMQQTNQALLENYQFRTLTACDGREAIDLYQEHQQEICAVLMDVMMPNMDGLTAIRHLRRMNPQVKIIAISGLPSKRQKALLAGANMFLSKPYTTQELLIAIQKTLGN